MAGRGWVDRVRDKKECYRVKVRIVLERDAGAVGPDCEAEEPMRRGGSRARFGRRRDFKISRRRMWPHVAGGPRTARGSIAGPDGFEQCNAVAAQANSPGMERLDLQFEVKAPCRGTAPPDAGDWPRGFDRNVITWGVELEGEQVVCTLMGADRAGCRPRRRVSSSGIMTASGAAVKSWSWSPGPGAASSGDAEHYAVRAEPPLQRTLVRRSMPG